MTYGDLQRLVLWFMFLALYSGLGDSVTYLGCYQISTAGPTYQGASDVATCMSTCESDGYMLLINISGIVCYCSTTNETTFERTECSECSPGYYCGDTPGIYGVYDLEVSVATTTLTTTATTSVTTTATQSTTSSSSSSSSTDTSTGTSTDTSQKSSSSEGSTWSIIHILAVAETTGLALLFVVVTVAVCCYHKNKGKNISQDSEDKTTSQKSKADGEEKRRKSKNEGEDKRQKSKNDGKDSNTKDRAKPKKPQTKVKVNPGKISTTRHVAWT